jgi:hypothetical protein
MAQATRPPARIMVGRCGGGGLVVGLLMARMAFLIISMIEYL